MASGSVVGSREREGGRARWVWTDVERREWSHHYHAGRCEERRPEAVRFVVDEWMSG